MEFGDNFREVRDIRVKCDFIGVKLKKWSIYLVEWSPNHVVDGLL